MITPTFHLHSSQGLVLQDPSRFKVLDAGRRWGKTFLALTALCIEGLQYPEARLWYVSPSYKQSKNISWILLKTLLKGVDVKYNESELSAFIKQTGSLIELKGADNEDSLRGAGLGTKHHLGGLALLVDEFATIYDNWSVWNEVLRPMLSDNRSGAMFISTPKGKDAFWELFMKGMRHENGWKSWQFPTIDNPYIDSAEVDEARDTMPQRYFRQEYEASFEDFTGLIYPEFNEKEHLVTPFEIPDWWEVSAAIDPAMSGTTAILFMVTDPEGYIYIIDEYREVNKRVSEVVSSIKFKEHKVKHWYIDPASKAKNMTQVGNLYSLYDEYADNGIHAVTAENDVHGGINRVAEHFKTNKLQIFSTCRQLVWELERYHWATVKETIKGETKAEPFKKDDHLCLSGSTEILMGDGSVKAIKDIVIGDYVKTNNGVQPVTDSQCTGKDIEVWLLKLSTGKVLVGTGGHKIYTNNDKKRLDCLRYGDIISVWTPYTLMEENIIGMVDTMQKVAERAVCILTSGYTTMVKSLKDIAYTIRTKILPTTIYPTLRYSHQDNICPITQRRDILTQPIENKTKHILRKSAHSPKNGTLVKLDESGTVSIAKKFGQTISTPRKNVVIVLRLIRHLSQLVQSIVQTIVGPPPTVQRIFNTHTKQDVYNITVANSHNYFANGILVSNCDCLKYLIASRPTKSKADGRVAPRYSVAWFQEREETQHSDWRSKYRR